MSTVSATPSVIASVGAGRTSVQIAVPTNPAPETTSDFMLEAAVRRVATMLYLRAHCDAPPKATDMGGGIFNVVV
jgi:hypothetical protein